MAVVDVFQNQREFRCSHCSGKILVPKELPSMTGPCPHCSSTITSPGPESESPAAQRVSAKIEVPAVIVHEPAQPEPRKSSGPPPLPPMKPAPALVGRSAEPSASPFQERSVAAVAEVAPPVVDFAAEKLAEVERALAAERERSETMAAAVAAEKALAEQRAAAIAAEKALAEQQAAAIAAEKILAEERAAQVAAEKRIAEDKAAAAERALAEERAAAQQRELAAAAERAIAEDRAVAAAQAIARQKVAAEEQSRAIERALAEERAKAAEQTLAREQAMAAERALAEEKSQAMAKALAEERALAQQRALAEEQARAAERLLAAEKALAEQKAREIEQALAREKALAEEKAAAAEKALALAAEKALEAERALAAEKALAAAKAFAEEKALAAERALAQEKAHTEEKALAAERALAAEKAFAEEKAIAEAKARAAEQALALAAEKAKSAERALAQERALAREKSLAAERALAEERAMAIAAEKALAEEKALAQQRAADREKELAQKKAYYQPDVAPGYEPTFASAPAADLPPRPPVARVELPVHPPARPVEKRSDEKRPVEPAPVPAAVPPTAPVVAPETEPLTADTPAAEPLVKPGRVKKNKPKPHPWTIKPPKPASRKALVIPMLVLLFLILSAGGTWIYFLNNKGRGSGSARPTMNAEALARQREKYYLQTGWQEDARQVLTDFLAADSAAGKSAFSINGSELLPRMDEFYGAGKIDDTDTPISGFSAEQLQDEDQKRGIFMMRYDQPPQFEMRDFFRPIAPLEVQHGLQEPDLLLSSMAKAGNFTSEPVKVHVFFKRTPDGLRVDWETFVQTKYRTFRAFTELPNPGHKEIFRLFVVEDVPEKGKTIRGMKTYRMADPAHKTDSVRIEVPIDSELGRALSILNWRGVKNARPKTKTATLELEWTRDPSPRLSISRFICWEFLGIGGQAVMPTPGK